MENASKALVMAGGILIALLVIGALLLMFNQLSDYQKSESVSTKTSQLTDFNKEFEKFTYDSIKGYDLITLVNKVVDYNKKTGVGNSVNYEEKITVYINIDGFDSKTGITTLFKKKIYTISPTENSFSSDINNFIELENKYTLSVMSKLSANYDTLKNAKNKQEYEDTMKKVVGRVVENNGTTITINQIAQYREYSEFKSSEFSSYGEVKYYPDGQIKSLSFKFDK